MRSPSLSFLVRQILLREGRSEVKPRPLRGDRLYHLSPISGIDEFRPREFAASPDGQSSGAAKTAPPEWERFHAVYASSSSAAPFYALPRDMPRAMPPIGVGSEEAVGEAIGRPLVRPTLLVDSSDLAEIRAHRLTVYELDPKDFKPVDGSEVEWISDRAVRPRAEWEVTDVPAFLTACGWDLIPVHDLTGLANTLQTAGVILDTEGI